MSKTTMAVFAAAALLLGACSGQSTNDAEEIAFLNANCPMMGNPIEAEGEIVSWQGHTIGFCCDGCAPKFEKLSDEEKVAALKEAGTEVPQ